MAIRSLTEIFVLMRNNALQSRHIFSDQFPDDRTRLMPVSQADPELGQELLKLSLLPPDWMVKVTQVQLDFARIRDKVKELSALHDKHLHRPTMDDNVDEKGDIEVQTHETTEIFTNCHRVVQQIKCYGQRGNPVEQKLAHNVLMSVARTLQDLSTEFRQSQSTYLRKMKHREERSQQYFGTSLSPDTMAASFATETDNHLFIDEGFSDVQLHMVERNEIDVQTREHVINQIIQSIQDLNDIFKDLANIIVDQGTILDRIDYNIDHSTSAVEKGHQQLEKAERIQKKNRKMMCIVGLAVAIVILLIILVAIKS